MARSKSHRVTKGKSPFLLTQLLEETQDLHLHLVTMYWDELCSVHLGLFPWCHRFVFFFSSHIIDVPSSPFLETSDASLSSPLFYLSKERDLFPFQVPGMRIRMWAGSLGGNDIRRREMLPLQNRKPNSSGSQRGSVSKGILTVCHDQRHCL